jgi:recombination protein RecA
MSKTTEVKNGKSEATDKIIKDIISNLNRASKEEDYNILADDDLVCDDFISTGNFAINYALSGRPITGGFPIGRVTEISGEAASGKTLLSTMGLIETQRRNGIAILIDTELAFWKDYFIRPGVAPKKLIRGTPECLEAVWRQVEELTLVVREKCPDKHITIVWDSVAASPSDREIKGDIADHEMAERARINSKGLRKITGKISKNKITLIAVNQVRQNVGVVYGRKEDSTGGMAWKFYASVRVETAKRSDTKLDKKEAVGARLITIKNKIFNPYQRSEYEIWYNKGVDPVSGFVSYGIENNFIENKKGSSWLNIPCIDKKFQRDTAINVFQNLVDTNFEGAEVMLGKDVDRIGTDAFKEGLEMFKLRLLTFKK